MGWKNWPYWLKGGIIGAFTGVVLSLLAFSCVMNTEGFSKLVCSVFMIPSLPLIVPLGLLLNLFSFDKNVSDLTLWIFWTFSNVLVSLVVGALVGWIYGKIKNRRESKK